MDWFAYGYWAAVGTTALFSMLLTFQAFEHRRYARSRARHHTRPARVKHTALFVPCKGPDVDLEPNLRPLFEQDHERYELVFVVESTEDPACLTIRRLMSQYPGTAARLVVAGISTTSGQKVHNLLAATENLPEHVEALAFVDADVRPPRDWLQTLTERLNKFSVTTGYRCFVPKRLTFANLLLTGINGSVVPIMFPGKHHLIWGGSWAIRREVFEASQLREDWKGTLSDDLIATRVMARIKQRVVAEPMCLLPSPLDVDMRGLFSFIRRQLMIGRCYVPSLWLALLFGATVVQTAFWGSLVAVAWGLAVGADWTWEPALAGGTLYSLHCIRAWLRHNASRYYLPNRQDELAAAWRFDLWLGPVAGLVGWLGLLASAVGNRIVWRGVIYEMAAGGQVRNILRPAATQSASQMAPQRKAA